MSIARSFRKSLSASPTAVIPRIARTMSSTAAAPQKFEFLVIIPDQAGALDRRMSVRPEHLKNVTPRVEDGFWKMGGALLDNVPAEGDPLKINGSCMLAVASSKEEVLEELKKDVYAKNNVWDFSKIQIYPFKCAFRNP